MRRFAEEELGVEFKADGRSIRGLIARRVRWPSA